MEKEKRPVGRPRGSGKIGDPWSHGKKGFHVRCDRNLFLFIHGRGGAQYLRDLAQAEYDQWEEKIIAGEGVEEFLPGVEKKKRTPREPGMNTDAEGAGFVLKAKK